MHWASERVLLAPGTTKELCSTHNRRAMLHKPAMADQHVLLRRLPSGLFFLLPSLRHKTSPSI